MIGAPARQSEPVLLTALWTVLNLLQIVAGVTWTVMSALGAGLTGALAGRSSAALAYARHVWAPGILMLFGVRLSVEGRVEEGAGARLFVANHRSALDIPVLFAAIPLPLSFLIKRELAKLPIVGWFCGATGMVFVDRDGGDRARASIDRMAEVLASGRSMVAFPEGTRSRDGSAKPFKRGPFVAAIKGGAQVVPVGIAGTGAVMPPRGYRFRPGNVAVRIGDELTTSDLSIDDRRDLALRAERAVARLRTDEGGAV